MNKIIFSVAACGLLAGCAESPDMLASVELPTCDKLAIPPNCDNNEGSGPANPKVTFNKNTLVVAPRNVCTNRGATLTFSIKPAAENENPPGSVAVIPKDGTDTWLIGTNSPDNEKIEINIPEYLEKDTYYEYTIVSVEDGDVSCVDPRVSVEK